MVEEVTARNKWLAIKTMRSERIINLSEAIVLQAEANYMNTLRRQYDIEANRHLPQAEETLDEMICEAKRLNPKNHIADEEEVIIYKLERKCKK